MCSSWVKYLVIAAQGYHGYRGYQGYHDGG